MANSKPKKRQQILIVEDDIALSDAFYTILEKEGFGVVRAFNGQEALDIIIKSPIDLILLDLLMPVMSGIEFLQQAQPDLKKQNIPVVVFSNLDSQKDIEQAHELGAARYMLKAWASPRELVKIVKDTLSQNSK